LAASKEYLTMSCRDCEVVWDLNQILNQWLAESESRAELWEGEARSVRTWADDRTAKIIRELRQEITRLKAGNHG